MAWATRLRDALWITRRATQLEAMRAQLLAAVILSPLGGQGAAREVKAMMEDLLRPIGQADTLADRYGQEYAEAFEQNRQELLEFLRRRGVRIVLRGVRQ